MPAAAASLPARNDLGPFAGSSPKLLLLKTLASALILLHLLAVFIAPATVGPSSDLERDTWTVMSPYLHATNLNFGYHFFAPEPSSTTLIEYVAVKPDGEEIFGRMPDRKTMVPRLLYHRYFMLTEYLGNRPVDDPMRQLLIRNFADQIMKNHHATSVKLWKVTHNLLSRESVVLGADINDLNTFDREVLGDFQCTEK